MRLEEAAERVLASLEESVRLRLMSDVPLGAMLSGGLDSTLIVALMRQHTTAEIHTFSIQTSDHDESQIAAETARILGTTHHTIELDDLRFEQLAELPRIYDEPFAETSALGVRALSLAARQYVKVALSGDGGDEVFGGYGSYRWIRALGLVPATPHAVSERSHQLLHARRWPIVMRRALRAALLAGDTPETAQRDVTTLAWAADGDARRESEQLSMDIAAHSGIDYRTLDAARRAMLADRLERLPNAMLAKVDAASMSASLEVRVPMLDDELVRYADNLPISDLVGWKWNKHVLRKALSKTSVGRIAWLKKRGFTLPLDRWMLSDRIAPSLDELFGDHAATLRDLTGRDVRLDWNEFRAGRSRFSQGTAAMQLSWFATVALWADVRGVRTSRATPLPASSII
jgi:asparagine synthase (glutamine-hydrolysing)